MLVTDLLNKIVAILEEQSSRRYWALIIMTLLAVVLMNGVAVYSDAHYQRLAQDPFVRRDDVGSTYQETLLLPLLANVLGLSEKEPFFVLCLIFILTGIFVFSWLSCKKFEPLPALLLNVLLIANPITTILFSWVGSADGLTFLLTIPILFVQPGWLMMGLMIFGVTNHILVLIAGLEIVLLRLFSEEDVKPMHMVFAVSGGLIGYGLVQTFLSTNGITTVPRLEQNITRAIPELIKSNFTLLPFILYSFFGFQWLLLPVMFVMFLERNRRYFGLLLLFLFLNYAVAFLTVDTTRIFVLLSWGVFFHGLMTSINLAKQEKTPEWQRQFLLAILVVGVVSILSPRFFVWNNMIEVSPFYPFLRLLFMGG